MRCACKAFSASARHIRKEDSVSETLKTVDVDSTPKRKPKPSFCLRIVCHWLNTTIRKPSQKRRNMRRQSFTSSSAMGTSLTLKRFLVVCWQEFLSLEYGLPFCGNSLTKNALAMKMRTSDPAIMIFRWNCCCIQIWRKVVRFIWD